MTPTPTAPDGPITHEEMRALFGEEMPIEAANLILAEPSDRTISQVRAELRRIASERAAPTAPEVAHLIQRLEKPAYSIGDLRTSVGLWQEAATALRSLQAERDRLAERVKELEVQNAKLSEFAASFSVTVVDNFYNDVTLHLISPHSLSIRIKNDSTKSWLFADLEERRRAAITKAEARSHD